MRRRFPTLAAAALALCVTGCGEDEAASPTEPSTSTEAQRTTPGPLGEELDAAGINLITGSDNGIPGDTRKGTSPPESPGEPLEEAADAARCELQLDLPDEGNTHIEPGEKPPRYRTDPPTSGDHIVSPLQQADGAYREYPAPVASVHSLEHGRVAIQYAPGLPEADQLLLKGVVEEEPGGMLLFPNRFMEWEVAATAWQQLIGCERWEGDATIAALRAFREEFRGEGPEDVPVDF